MLFLNIHSVYEYVNKSKPTEDNTAIQADGCLFYSPTSDLIQSNMWGSYRAGLRRLVSFAAVRSGIFSLLLPYYQL